LLLKKPLKGAFASSFLFLEERLGVPDVLEGGFLVLRVGVRLDLTGVLSGALALVARVGIRLGARDVLSGTLLVTRVGMLLIVAEGLSGAFFVTRVGVRLGVPDVLEEGFFVLRVGVRLDLTGVLSGALPLVTRVGMRLGAPGILSGTFLVTRVGMRLIVPVGRVGRGFGVSRKGTPTVERRKLETVFETTFLVDLSGAGTFRVGAVTADERAGGGERLGADTDRSGGFRVLRVGAS